MRHLIGNLKPYWKTVIILALLLMVQAFCDLSLPGYTQNIIDVGIQNKGISHIVPEAITEGDFQSAQVFMTEEEKNVWQSVFTDETAGIRKRTVNDEASLDALDDSLITPIVLAYRTEHADAGTSGSSEASASQQSGVMDISSLPRDQMEKMIAQVGTRTIKAMGIAFAIECDQNAGVDVVAIQKHYLITCGARMLAMALLMLIAASMVSFFASRVGAGIGKNIRGKLFRNVMSYSSAEIDKFQTSSLITRCTNDVQQVQNVSVMMLRMVLYAPIVGSYGVYRVWQTGANMGWIVGLAVIAIMALVSGLMSVTIPKFRSMQTLVDGLNSVSREILTGLPVIRAFGREETEEERFDTANIALRNTQLFTGRAMNFMHPGMTLIMYLTIVAITWVSARKIDAGTLQVGAMTAFITYSMQIVMSFLMITMMSILLPRAGVAADRIDQVLRVESSVRNAENAREFSPEKGEVVFDHVYFRYPGGEEDALEDIDFTCEAGKTTAIIGSTGSGKSTIVNLLPRFYDVTKGSIKIDGVDIRDVTMESLRAGIGFVPQKGVLFTGTVAENIRFGKEDATQEEIERAAKLAMADGFVSDMENGYESIIAQGGSNVSGGQKQRLSIARALVKEAGIVVFDDSFSALDMKTDAELRRNLDEEHANVTKIIVAQRISTILNADRIIVVDDGKIVGNGTHAELMESCDVYGQIARSQLSERELEGIK